jgi:hypothetical protein
MRSRGHDGATDSDSNFLQASSIEAAEALSRSKKESGRMAELTSASSESDGALVSAPDVAVDRASIMLAGGARAFLGRDPMTSRKTS